jgi:hypothetical protein
MVWNIPASSSFEETFFSRNSLIDELKKENEQDFVGREATISEKYKDNFNVSSKGTKNFRHFVPSSGVILASNSK